MQILFIFRKRNIPTIIHRISSAFVFSVPRLFQTFIITKAKEKKTARRRWTRKFYLDAHNSHNNIPNTDVLLNLYFSRVPR